MKRIALTALLTLALIGCASFGTDFKQEDVASIHKGETTEAQLLQTFGNPYTTTSNSNGTRTLTWTYAHATAFSPGKGKSLMVKLNESGVVEKYLLTNVN